MILFRLFITFFEIGLFTFGGGYAMISLVREKVLSHGWMTDAELSNMIAVSESTPGPIAVNMATFVGSTQAGILGSAMATLGVVLPSFIIILLISAIMKNFLKYEPVKAFLLGVRPCVIALIMGTAVTLGLSTLFGFKSIGTPIETTAFSPDIQGIVIFLAVMTSAITLKKITGKKPSPIILILISAILGMIIYSIWTP